MLTEQNMLNTMTSILTKKYTATCIKLYDKFTYNKHCVQKKTPTHVSVISL